MVLLHVRNELKFTKAQMKSLEDGLAIYTGLNNDPKTDTEIPQK